MKKSAQQRERLWKPEPRKEGKAGEEKAKGANLAESRPHTHVF